ncbi:MAG: hypothetical protein H6Q17_1824 [Bacteroidetes bacterium]|nr:hypothetical protein [Bacteroidota bacterium]
MAESKNNIVTHGLSGTVGDMLVFRNRAGKTIVSAKPKERTGEPSEAQIKHQSRFQEATLYGKSVLADPTLKEEYKAAAPEGVTAYNVAVSDFMHAPNIKEVNVSKYTGKTGDTIEVEVTDDFKVMTVSVTIYNADGSEVEHGNAVQQVNEAKWLYTATITNASLSGDKIVIRAFDLPGNISGQEKTLG